MIKEWRPHPGAQTEFHQRNEFEVLYGGARGGGKSESLLIESLRYVEYPDYKALLLRRTFPELQEILDRSKRLFPSVIPGAKWREQEKRWHMPSGAIVRMGHIEHEDDKYHYMGHEYQYIGIDELTHFTQSIYLFIMGSCRSTNPKIPARMRATTNPGNIGHEWVKERFIDPAPPKTVIRDKITGLERVFIPATVYDNPTLMNNDPQYVKRLEAIPDDKIRRMMLYGDWDVFTGQAFSDFKRELHVIKPFNPPVEWKRFIAIDWGYSRPFAIYWFAQDPLDRLYVYKEWYGVALDERGAPKPDVGVQMDAESVAIGVLQRCEDGVVYNHCVMDSKMWTPSGIGDSFVAADFERILGKRGIPVIKAFQSPGSRVAGKQQLHVRLKTRADGRPGILFTENCVNLIRTLPYLPTDKHNQEDVDTNAEDHAFDAIKYGLSSCMSFVEKDVHTQYAQIEGFRRQRPKKQGLVYTYG